MELQTFFLASSCLLLIHFTGFILCHFCHAFSFTILSLPYDRELIGHQMANMEYSREKNYTHSGKNGNCNWDSPKKIFAHTISPRMHAKVIEWERRWELLVSIQFLFQTDCYNHFSGNPFTRTIPRLVNDAIASIFHWKTMAYSPCMKHDVCAPAPPGCICVYTVRRWYSHCIGLRWSAAEHDFQLENK